jgi:hypothetical protein
MEPSITRRCARAFVVTAIALLLTVGAAPRPRAGRRPARRSTSRPPPDWHLTGARCLSRWRPPAPSGGASSRRSSASHGGRSPDRHRFPLTCIGSPREFTVTVSASGGSFQLGAAQASASVLIKRGNIQRAQDSQSLDVQPAVVVELADTAQLESGGGAVTIAVTVACPVGVTALMSSVNVSQQV